MKTTSRALRRHHRARMHVRATYILTNVWFMSPEDAHEYALRTHNNMKKCSCYMCGNVRRNGWTSGLRRLTMQERKVYNLLDDELEEFYDDLV